MVKNNVIANAPLFILSTAMWIVGAHTRSFDPDYDEPCGPTTGPYLEQRTYQQAMKDAYWPMANGNFPPDFDWYLTISLMTTRYFTYLLSFLFRRSLGRLDLNNPTC